MAITTRQHESTQITATISVRVSQNTEADLMTAAKQRLSALDAVSEVDVTGFDAIDPRLSATVVTVTATIDTQTAVQELRDELSETVAVEGIDQLTQTAA
jgi:hypothetical protein